MNRWKALRINQGQPLAKGPCHLSAPAVFPGIEALKLDEPVYSTTPAMSKGYLALVLHTHLPFVRHPEYPEFLEEDWFFQAITETYVPLIDTFAGLLRDKIPFRLTVSLSPTLLSMLSDPLLQSRYMGFLGRAQKLAELECRRTQGQPEFLRLAEMYREKLGKAEEIFFPAAFSPVTF